MEQVSVLGRHGLVNSGGLRARHSAVRRRISKVRREIERAYVNIGTFTSERVHQSGSLTQRCAGTSQVRFLRRPIEKCRTSIGSITGAGGTQRCRRSTAALLSPPRCWYIYRLIIGLVCVTIMKLKWHPAEGARRYRVWACALHHAARAAFRFYLRRRPIHCSPVIHIIHTLTSNLIHNDIFLASVSVVGTFIHHHNWRVS